MLVRVIPIRCHWNVLNTVSENSMLQMIIWPVYLFSQCFSPKTNHIISLIVIATLENLFNPIRSMEKSINNKKMASMDRKRKRERHTYGMIYIKVTEMQLHWLKSVVDSNGFNRIVKWLSYVAALSLFRCVSFSRFASFRLFSPLHSIHIESKPFDLDFYWIFISIWAKFKFGLHQPLSHILECINRALIC